MEIVAFIDEHRHRFGVEPICRVLTEHGCKIAPNTYRVARKRPLSARAERDAELVAEIVRVYESNMFVYGADKVWAQLNRESIRVARCTVERLMRRGTLRARAARRSRSPRPDDRLHRPADLVARVPAPAPNRLWVADLTYVKTPPAGCTWRSSSTFSGSSSAGKRRGRCARSGDRRGGDGRVNRRARRRPRRWSITPTAASNMSIRTPNLADNASSPRSDRRRQLDNAMAESFNGLYKWELIYRQGPWRGLDDVEFATMTYVDWFNHLRLPGEITDYTSYTTPAEAEAVYYRQSNPAAEAVTQ